MVSDFHKLNERLNQDVIESIKKNYTKFIDFDEDKKIIKAYKYEGGKK